ncbi:hypothetical protein CBR_g52153 [Chara braunii]|uniref:DUF659 domain-containing protein n=1 Tax=Chara braunii TaxID=69332 RepID=A0A388M9L6_CHABU|nr:hypothetical protein CBR_g52153 [Chara braunii]|eukprot:GBG91268.1 hypothetical protein CBR_g52153 [Chara braunii]
MKGPVGTSCDKPRPCTQRRKFTVCTASASGKEPAPGTESSLFKGQGETEHAKLRLKNTVWNWCDQGQEVVTSKGCGEYWIRCRLCFVILRGSTSKVVEYFLRPMKPCAMRTGEIVHTLVAVGVKIHLNDKNRKYLLKNYKGPGVESEVLRDHGLTGQEGFNDPQIDELQPSSVAGRSVARSANLSAAVLGQASGEEGAAAGGGSDEGQGSTTRVVTTRQTTVRRLLLKDFTSLSWIKGIVKTANTIVKFIRNHHATHGLMMFIDDTLSLLRPTEVCFRSVYMTLQRSADRENVLTEMVDGRAAAKWRSLRWSGEKLRRKADLVYYTARSESWWPQVKKIVAIMRPVYQMLKRMDVEGNSPTNLVEYDEHVARRLTSVVLTKKEREDVIEKKEEEERRQRRMVKAPKGRIPKELVDSDSGGSSDLEDLVWKGKCWNESSSEDCGEEEAGDSDFKVREAPIVPTTAYVGRRTRQRERDLEVELMPVVDVVDTNVEFLFHPHDDPDEEEATHAKAMADRDAELVDKRMRRRFVVLRSLPAGRGRDELHNTTSTPMSR